MHSYSVVPVLLLAVALLAEDRARAQNVGASELDRTPLLPRYLGAPIWDPGRAPARARLFRMPSGFGSDPVGLEDEEVTPETVATEPAATSRDPLDERLRVAVGNDNPFFDFRWRGDVGGVGYYKLQTQVVVLESTTTGLSLDLQAVMPAGLESEGLANGPTVLRPALAYSREVTEGTAVHGFVGKRLDAIPRGSAEMRRGLQYGLALESPLPGLELPTEHAIHWFVEAIGNNHFQTDASQAAAAWKVLPGVQWRVGESWWMSGGLSVPVGPVRPDSRLWQITCSWQF